MDEALFGAHRQALFDMIGTIHALIDFHGGP